MSGAMVVAVVVIVIGVVLVTGLVLLFLESRRTQTLQHEIAMTELRYKIESENTRQWTERQAKQAHWPPADQEVSATAQEDP